MYSGHCVRNHRTTSHDVDSYCVVVNSATQSCNPCVQVSITVLATGFPTDFFETANSGGSATEDAHETGTGTALLHTPHQRPNLFIAILVLPDGNSSSGTVRRAAQRGVTNLSDKNLRHTAPSRGAWREQAVNARGGRVVTPMARGPSGMPRTASSIRKASDLSAGFSSEGDSSAVRASGNNSPGGDRKVTTAAGTKNKVGLLGRLTGWVRRMFS
jgi:hypothetical protein